MHRKRPLLPRRNRVVAEPLEPRRLLSTGSVSGLVYLDQYGSNLHQPSDQPLAGISVTLHSYANPGADVSAKSAADGTFTFSGLADGSYAIYLTAGPYHPDYGYNGNVTVTGGQNATASPLGLWQFASVSGTVFNDVNGNGIQDAGEEGVGTADAGVEPHNVG